MYLCANGVHGCGAIRYEKYPAIVEIRTLDLAPPPEPEPEDQRKKKKKKKKTLKGQKTGGGAEEPEDERIAVSLTQRGFGAIRDSP